MIKRYVSNGLALLFVVFIAVYALIFNNVVGWTAFFFVVPLSLVCFFMVSVPYLFTFQAKDININQGERFTLTFNTKSKWRWYPFISTKLVGQDIQLQSKPTSIFFSEQSDFEYDTQNILRGVYIINEIQVSLSDPFSILSREMRYSVEIELVIYPEKRMFEAESLHQNLTYYFLGDHHFAPNETFDLNHIRDYVPGDLPNRIDWKLSSKKQNLQYRVYDLEMPLPPRLVLLAQEHETFEYLLSVFYTFETEFNQNNTFDTKIVASDIYEKPSARTMAKLKSVTSLHYDFEESDVIMGPISELPRESKNSSVSIVDNQLVVQHKDRVDVLHTWEDEVVQ